MNEKNEGKMEKEKVEKKGRKRKIEKEIARVKDIDNWKKKKR